VDALHRGHDDVLGHCFVHLAGRRLDAEEVVCIQQRQRQVSARLGGARRARGWAAAPKWRLTSRLSLVEIMFFLTFQAFLALLLVSRALSGRTRTAPPSSSKVTATFVETGIARPARRARRTRPASGAAGAAGAAARRVGRWGWALGRRAAAGAAAAKQGAGRSSAPATRKFSSFFSAASGAAPSMEALHGPVAASRARALPLSFSPLGVEVLFVSKATPSHPFVHQRHDPSRGNGGACRRSTGSTVDDRRARGKDDARRGTLCDSAGMPAVHQWL